MTQRAVVLELIRDGQCTPWGFRLTGGHDVGAPLVIQRVSLGSPSEGELQKGDIILSINDTNATQMSHLAATNVISKAGNILKLVVARNTGLPPISPTPGTPTTLYHLRTSNESSSPFISPLLTFSPDGNTNLFRSLPRTEFPMDNRGYYTGSPHFTNSADLEKEAITHQPFRSFPLITPGCKATKDAPVGSYLKYIYDGSGRTGTPTSGRRISDAFMLSKVQETVLDAAFSSPRASSSSSRTSTPDIGYQNLPQIYHRQYNSPINMYSNQAIMDTITAQTVVSKMQRPSLREALKDVIMDAVMCLSDNPSLCNETKVLTDISKSPTYQLIHEHEWKDLNKQKLMEHQPVSNKVYDVTQLEKSDVNTACDDISQSSSFKNLMSNLQSVKQN